MLTKSLYTVTAALNVARHLRSTVPTLSGAGPIELTRESLMILGYYFSAVQIHQTSDPTIQRIVDAVMRDILADVPS